MWTWLLENLATILISAILLAVIAAIIVHLVHNRRAGKTSCGCGCSSCPMEGKCHPKSR